MEQIQKKFKKEFGDYYKSIILLGNRYQTLQSFFIFKNNDYKDKMIFINSKLMAFCLNNNLDFKTEFTYNYHKNLTSFHVSLKKKIVKFL